MFERSVTCLEICKKYAKSKKSLADAVSNFISRAMIQL